MQQCCSYDVFLVTAADNDDSERLKSLIDESTVDINVALGPMLTNALVIAAKKGYESTYFTKLLFLVVIPFVHMCNFSVTFLS